VPAERPDLDPITADISGKCALGDNGTAINAGEFVAVAVQVEMPGGRRSEEGNVNLPIGR
jgi:hypothetical protein